MKKLFLPILFIAIFWLSSCSDFLDENPKGRILGVESITDVKQLDAALTGAYFPLENMYVTGLTTAGAICAMAGADDITSITGSNKANILEFDQFNVNNLNDRAREIWGIHKSILNANMVINAVGRGQVKGTNAEIDPIVGEAHYLRAFCRYWLIRLWGPIPLIDTEIYSDDLLTIEKTPPHLVYKSILADLEIAEKFIGDRRRNDEMGRPNKGTIHALLADINLTMAGWPLNKPEFNPEYSGTWSQAHYEKAAEYAREVIDNKSKYGFELYPDIKELWANKQSTWNRCKSEYVLAITCLGFNKIDGWHGNSTYSKAPRPEEFEGGFNDFCAEVNFWAEYPEGARKQAYFLTEWPTQAGAEGIGYPKNSYIHWTESKYKHPYYKKYLLWKEDGLVLEDSWSPSAPQVFIRYAHLPIIYAEATLRSGKALDQVAIDEFNAIRNRAGLTPIANPTLTDVMNERKWEFAGEFSRWFDLVRLEKVPEANAIRQHTFPRGTKWTMESSGRVISFSKATTFTEVPIIGNLSASPEEFCWLPIYYQDVVFNPNLSK